VLSTTFRMYRDADSGAALLIGSLRRSEEVLYQPPGSSLYYQALYTLPTWGNSQSPLTLTVPSLDIQEEPIARCTRGYEFQSKRLIYSSTEAQLSDFIPLQCITPGQILLTTEGNAMSVMALFDLRQQRWLVFTIIGRQNREGGATGVTLRHCNFQTTSHTSVSFATRDGLEEYFLTPYQLGQDTSTMSTRNHIPLINLYPYGLDYTFREYPDGFVIVDMSTRPPSKQG
jgi:hypothetical protein